MKYFPFPVSELVGGMEMKYFAWFLIAPDIFDNKGRKKDNDDSELNDFLKGNILEVKEKAVSFLQIMPWPRKNRTSCIPCICTSDFLSSDNK